MFNFVSWFRGYFYVEEEEVDEDAQVMESPTKLSESSAEVSSSKESPEESFIPVSMPESTETPSSSPSPPPSPPQQSPPSPSAPMHINDLPTDCLLAIFAQLSLHDRLQSLRLVCAAWFTLVEEMAMRARSLTLLGAPASVTDLALTLINENAFESEERRLKKPGSPSSISNSTNSDQCYDDDLIIEGANPKVVFTLTMLFSRLETLTVHLSAGTPFPTLRLWLMQLPALRRLTLAGFIEHQEDGRRFLERILPTLNALDRLEELHLLATNFFVVRLAEEGDEEESDGEDEGEERTVPFAPALSRVLAQLTAFSLAHYDGSLYSVLRALTPATHCRRLRLDVARDRRHCTEVELRQLVTFNRALFDGLTHLRFALPDTRLVSSLVAVLCREPPLVQSEEQKSSSPPLPPPLPPPPPPMPNLVSLDLQSCAVMNFELIKIDAPFIEALNRLPALTELRLSHIALDLLDYDFETTSLDRIERLHLSQVRLHHRSGEVHERTMYAATSTDRLLWRSLAFLFPRLKELYVRVRRSAVPLIEEHVKAFWGGGPSGGLERAKIYSVEDEVGRFYGRHPLPGSRSSRRSEEGGDEGDDDDEVENMQFFSQYVFDKLKRL